MTLPEPIAFLGAAANTVIMLGDTSLLIRHRCCLQAGMKRKCEVSDSYSRPLALVEVESTEICIPRTRRLNLKSFVTLRLHVLYYSPLLEPDVIPKTPVCP